MVKKSLTFLFALLFLISVGTVFAADFAKEGSGEYRSGKSGTSTVLVMGKERMQMNFEQLGAVVLAPENSPFQLYLKCNIPLFQFLQDYVLDCATHTLPELWIAAMNPAFQ